MGLFDANKLQISNPAALGSTCGKCYRHKYCDSPRMGIYGSGHKGLMIIGSMPDRGGDAQGIPISGAGARYLEHILDQYDVSMASDCTFINAVACHGKNPVASEITACRGRVFSAIAKHKPKAILALGMDALEALLGHRWNKKKDDDSGLGTITRWAGWAIPDRQTSCFVIPTWPIKYILDERENTPSADVWFKRHIKLAVKCLNMPFPHYKDEYDCIEVAQNDDDALDLLAQTIKQDWFSFDYETTGLKPYREVHSIKYIGIGDGFDHAYCFPTTCKRAVKFFQNMLANPDLGKVAHNMAYEDLWSLVKLGVTVQNWRMCTLLASHIHNQNPGLIGLKFQAYVRLGLVDYSSHISPYIETPLNEAEEKMGANRLNQITLAPPMEVMKYCAIDCLSTYRIAVLMDDEMKLERL